MDKIKVGVIGTGHDHAADAVKALKSQSDAYDIIGFAETKEDSLNSREYSYEARKDAYDGIKKMTVEEILFYPGLDAVCIETEDRALTKYAKMAAERGLHIQMDKPGGIDQNEFDELIDIAKDKQIVLHIAYMYRYNPEIIKLKENINSGKIGDVLSIEAQMSTYLNTEKREWLGNYPGGMMYFLGCHLVDLVYSICGEPEDVIPFNLSSGIDGISSKDFGMAVFKYKNGVSFVKSTAVEYGGFARRQLVVCGTKGTVELRPLESVIDNPKMFVPLTTGVREVYDATICRESEVFGRYDTMYRALASYVRGEKKNPFDYEYERGLHKLILKACEKEIEI